MQIPKSEHYAEITGANKIINFEIGSSGLIIEYLRDKIYTNPIKAICREIACNARDAHREVGTPDLPIKIKLPSDFEPYIRIQDFGPGISSERMADIYCKFGNSTKRDSNDQLGGFGIGGKSILAYSDSFTIETINDGIKYIYNGVIDESRAGKMILQYEEFTDEPSGTTIIVPVKRQDMKRFASEVVHATSYWPIRPELSGIDPLPKYHKVVKTHEGTGWKMETSTTFSGSACAIIDGIRYEIDKYIFYDDFNYDQKSIFDSPLVLDYNVGELSLAISRDTLHMDDRTKGLIKDRIHLAFKEVRADIIKQIANASTYKEACKMYKQISNLLPKNLINGWASTIKWKDSNGDEYPLRFKMMAKDIGQWTKIVTYKLNYRDDIVCTNQRSSDNVDFLSDTTALLHNDKGKNINKRHVEWLLHNLPNVTSLQILTTSDNPNTAAWKRELRYDDNLKAEYNHKLLHATGAKKLSEIKIPKMKVVRDPSRILQRGHILGYNLRLVGGEICTTSTQHPIEKGGVYVKVDYRTRSFTSDSYNVSSYLFETAKKLLGVKIVGFSEKRCEKLGEHWQSLRSALLERVSELLITVAPIGLLRTACGNKDVSGLWSNMNFLRKSKDDLAKDSPLVRLIDLGDITKKVLVKHNDLLVVMRWLDKYPLGCKSSIKELRASAEKLYPAITMLDSLQRYYGEKDKEKKILDYIRSMDRLRELENLLKVEDSKLILVSA